MKPSSLIPSPGGEGAGTEGVGVASRKALSLTLLIAPRTASTSFAVAAGGGEIKEMRSGTDISRQLQFTHLEQSLP